ncbi:MAG TPA: MFS transporter [Acidobacteriaceae bacterium]|nr:MFS transporter [Acidobacteriaceae bacterium]
MRPKTRAWYSVALVTAAIAISYFDRQTLPVAIAAIQRNIPISNVQFASLQTAFLITYALLYVGGGKLLDAVGTRRGFALIMIWWSLACALQGLARGLSLLLTARLLLGMGEGGGFPAATRVVAEWLPADRRSTGMGIINAGTAVGSVLAPPLIGLILAVSTWRWMFFVSGGLGLLWVSWWLVSTRSENAGEPTPTRTVPSIPWTGLLRSRQVIGLVAAKFLSDSAWYFYLFWLPKYLYDARGFDIKHVSAFGWIPYAASGVGSFLGGWFSSRLMRSGHSLNYSRKLALGISAALMPAVMLVPKAPIALALLLFSIVFFGQQSWSGLIMTIPADIFPLRSVGSVAGLIGFGGAVGGATFGMVAGELLAHGSGYGTLFVLAGSLHLTAFGIILLTSGVLRAPTSGLNSTQGALVLP